MSAFDAFLEIDGIEGEAEDSKMGKQVELLSYSFGATQTGSFQYGGGGSTGKVAFNDFHFTKRCDSSTPKLLEACCAGKHIPKCTMSLRKSGGGEGSEQQVFYQVVFSDVVISSQSISGVGSGDPVPTESISFNFGAMVQEYFKQDAKGKVTSAAKRGWDQKKNTAKNA